MRATAPPEGDTVIQIDGEEVFRAVSREADRQFSRTVK
jgi:hypothetical protein